MTTMTKYPAGESTDGWEDSYYGEAHPSFEDLERYAESMWLGNFANLNWPVWVEYDDENEYEYDCGPTVSVGVFMPRHGNCAIHIAPATPEQAHAIRIIVMRVWALRADMQFRRYQPYSQS